METLRKSEDHINTMTDFGGNLFAHSMSWTTKICWCEIKPKLDRCSEPFIGVKDHEVMSRAKSGQKKILGRDFFRMIDKPHAVK